MTHSFAPCRRRALARVDLSATSSEQATGAPAWPLATTSAWIRSLSRAGAWLEAIVAWLPARGHGGWPPTAGMGVTGLQLWRTLGLEASAFTVDNVNFYYNLNLKENMNTN